MQFRVKHMLFATAVVAAFAWALTSPGAKMVGTVEFIYWLSLLILLIRASTHRRERVTISMGLVASLSYYALIRWGEYRLPTSHLLSAIHPKLIPISSERAAELAERIQSVHQPMYESNPAHYQFNSIGHIGFAVIFGFLAAGLAAYWSRRQHEGA